MLGILLAAAIAASAPGADPEAPDAAPPVVYIVDQLVCEKPPKRLSKKLQPLQTLSEVRERLRAADVPCEWRQTPFNTGAADPKLVWSVEKLEPGEIFVIEQDGRTVFNLIVGRR